MNEAKTETEKAEEEELRRLTALEASTNLENHPYTDKNGDSVTIPAGFAVSQVEGENTIVDGLVIIDKNGNEFVWVPVNNYNDFKRYEGYRNGSLQKDYLLYCGESDSTGTNEYLEKHSITETEETRQESVKMYSSIEKNKGFYIGRYESGVEGERTSGILDDVVIKQGKNVYNQIGWSNSANMIVETGGAVELARNFDIKNGYTSVKSTLTYGVQWDAVMQFIDSKYIKGECLSSSFIVDSSKKGNYSGNLSKTGSNRLYSIKNIYDLAGNVSEWTMESYDTSSRVHRGGSYIANGFEDSVSNRRNTNPSLTFTTLGFRIALYLN